MSIEGKKIAAGKQSVIIANMIIRANIAAFKSPVGIRFIMSERAKSEAFAMAYRLDKTPHQHFNSKGQVDKRKVRRYKRKMGFKPHTARILRLNTKRISDEGMTTLIDKINSSISGPYAVRGDI